MASTYQGAVDQTITAGEQIHQIVNGTATTEVTVEDGSKVPSIRKALLDNFYFKDPIAWQVGQTENVFNQLRQFTDGSWWYAPSATASNLISMGATPVGDPLWKIYDFDAIGKLEPRVDETLRRSYAEAGYNVVGTFQDGFTIVNSNDVGIDLATGKGYTGTVGPVAAGTNPASGGFVDRSKLVTTMMFSNVDAMLSFNELEIGQRCSTGSTVWSYVGGGASIENFKALTPVYYRDFALRVNDPTADNYSKIADIHAAANRSRMRVIGDVGNGYINIGLLPDNNGIHIATDCDWAGSSFRFSAATSTESLYSQKRFLSCTSETIAELSQSQVNINEFFAGAKYLPSISSLGYSNVVIAIYSDDVFLNRNGDTSQPIRKRELCAVFENGALTSPLQFTYSSISKIEIYALEKSRLSLKNISFILEDGFKSAVALYLQRNNTDLHGVYIEEDDNVNRNCSRNFMAIYNNYNSTISKVSGNGFQTGGGTYLLRPELTEAVEISGIKAVNGWGVFGGNYNKNIKYFDCDVNRIDQHALGQDCIIERCSIFDNAGIAVTGKGKLSITDCTFYTKANGLNLVTLRSDYASIWDGEIHISRCKAVVELANPSQTELGVSIVEASILNVDFKTDHIFPSVFIDGISIDSDAQTTLVTCYNLPSNTGVNNQNLPPMAKIHNVTTRTPRVRVRATPPIVADNPKLKGSGMMFDLRNLHNDYTYVHSSSYDVSQTRKDAILCFIGTDYVAGVPFSFSAQIEHCDNCGFVWTLPTPIKVSGCNRIAAMLTRAANGTGNNFANVANAVHVYNSSVELMNYRGNQEFMIEDINARNLEFFKPTVNTQVGSYRSIKLNTMISAQGCVLRSDCPIVTGDESLIAQVFTGVKKSNWRS